MWTNESNGCQRSTLLQLSCARATCGWELLHCAVIPRPSCGTCADLTTLGAVLITVHFSLFGSCSKSLGGCAGSPSSLSPRLNRSCFEFSNSNSGIDGSVEHPPPIHSFLSKLNASSPLHATAFHRHFLRAS